MGTLTIDGNAKARGASSVLLSIVREAAKSTPYNVSVFSGARNGGGSSMHDQNKAIDVVLTDPSTGQEIPNLKSSAGFPVYEKFAQQMRAAQMKVAPDYAKNFRWGGWFGSSGLNPGGVDLMHFDLKSSALMQGGNWESGTTPAWRKYVAGLGPGFVYSANGQFREDGKKTYANLWGREPILAPDQPTEAAGLPNEVPQRATLRKGDEGMDVAALQMRLQNAGLYKGPIDGKFGAGTAEGVRAAERAANLRIDKGVAGPQVQTALAGNTPRFPGNPSNVPGSSLAGYIPSIMPNAPQRVADMGTEAFGFGPKLPPAALFPSSGPTPPAPIPAPYMGNGPGRSPSGPAGPLPQRPTSSPYVSDAGGQPFTVGDVQSGPLSPVYAGNGPGRSPSGPAPYNPFSQPQPWGAVADQSLDTLGSRLAGPRMPASAPFGFAQAGGAGSVAMAPDVSGGRNLALMGRAPVNMANAAGADNVTSPAMLRDQQQAASFGNFLRSIYGGAQPAQASAPSFRYDPLSSARMPFTAMPAINRAAPQTISPQQFQQRFAPMGAASIPQDVTYRTASLSPVIANSVSMAPKSITQAQFSDRFNPAPVRYDPLSSAYTYKTISVPGVTFAKPTAPTTPAGGESDLSKGAALGASLAGAGAFGVGAVAEPPKPKPTITQRLVRVAVPMAASAVMGPVGGLLAGGLTRLAQGGPLAQRVGQAISYANAQPRSNSYAASPFTPMGFTAPNYNPTSGGSIYAYRTTSPGVGSYINSAGRTINYNVNADQAVYGSGGGLGGFRP